MGRVYTTFLNPKDCYDFKIIKANLLVQDWMKDIDNRVYLNELKAEALHEKGHSVAGNIKHKHIIPEDAFLALPEEIRLDKKKVNRWLTTYHPYLLISK